MPWLIGRTPCSRDYGRRLADYCRIIQSLQAGQSCSFHVQLDCFQYAYEKMPYVLLPNKYMTRQGRLATAVLLDVLIAVVAGVTLFTLK